KLHGGDIEVASELGKGTTFYVKLLLPVKEGVLQKKDMQEEEERNSISDTSNGKQAILLAEDNEEFRHYLADCLSDEFTVVMAEDGKVGLQKVLSHMPDLIITDMMMPHMDGVALCQHVKKDIRTSHIPVIILTARNSEEKHLEGLDSGCNLYITKPFNLDILLSSIRNLLQERERL